MSAGEPSRARPRVRRVAGVAIGAGLALGAMSGHLLASQIVQPGAPGQPARVISADEAVAHARVAASAADVQFMRGMVGHHAQALEMTALVPGRTTHEEFLSLTVRIEVSQRDEIKTMQDWLRAHGAPEADPHAHHAPGATLMPGMLTPAEMTRLAGASGVEFERLFLELMIKHHAGALTMVADLLAKTAGGASPDVFAFASDVEADQRMEIARMRAMLGRR